ncbi:MAG: 50S ribosomal protein L3 [Patescibacteria group bacterium]|jgi:large subunit ribosomal protein L3
MRAIYGKKLMMTRLFDESGKNIAVTVLEMPENTVTQIKKVDKDGYQAYQFGMGEKRRLNKAEAGHLAPAKTKSAKLFEVKTNQDLKVGDKIGLEILNEGELVNVTGISKGKGFQGTVKRHHFNTGPRTHGSNNYRQPGSIGSTFPQRVVKGRRMGGHMGAERVTSKNIEVFKVDRPNKRIYLKGAVPGANQSLVLIWSPNEKPEIQEAINEA